MSDLFDRDGNLIPATSPEDAQRRFLAGEAAFAQGSRVPVVDPVSGRQGDVPAEQAAQAFRSGLQLSTPEALATAREEARLQRERGTVGQIAQTATEGFERGATVGLSDAARTSDNPLIANLPITGIGSALGIAADLAAGGERTGEERAAEMRERQDANPGTALAGELGGIVAGSVATRSPLPASAVARVGLAAERGVLSLLGGTARGGLARQAAARGVGLGVGGAVEGAAFGAGHVISEDALGRADLTGERLASSMGMGAMMGFGGGAALGAGGRLLGRATERATSAATLMGQRQTERLRQALGLNRLQRIANEQAFQALRPYKKFVTQAMRRGDLGGVEGIGEVLMRRGIVDARSSLDDMAERLVVQTRQVGDELGDIIRRADAVEGSAPTLQTIRANVEDLAAKLRRSGTGSGERLAGRLEGEVRPFMSRFDDGTGPTLEELHAFRRSIDDIAFRGNNAMNPNPINQELQALRRVLEDEVEAGVQRAARSSGDEGLAAYQALKKDYGALMISRATAENRIAADAANRSFSLSDYMGAITGTAGVAALDIGIPGASLAGGFLFGAFNKFLRENGAQITAVGASRLARYQAARRAQAAAGKKMDTAVQRFLSGNRAPSQGTRTARRAATVGYLDAVRGVQEHVQNPEASVERMASQTEGLSSVAPTAAANAHMTVQRGAHYLHQHIPSASRTSTAMFGRAEEPLPVAPSQQAEWMRRLAVVQDPSVVFDRMAEGTVTPEEVETLKEVYPATYTELVTRVTQWVSEQDELPAYQNRLQLGQLLGIPMDPTQDPTFVAAIQSRNGTAQQPERPEWQPKPNLSQAVDSLPDLQSDSQRLAGRRAQG